MDKTSRFFQVEPETPPYAGRQSVLETFHVADVKIRMRKRSEILRGQLGYVEVYI